MTLRPFHSHHRLDGRGQSSVEMVLVIPIFLLLLGAIIDLAWVLGSDAMLRSTINTTEWTITSDDVAADDMDATVLSAIKENSTMVDKDAISVSDASITYDSKYVNNVASAPGTDISSVMQRTKIAHITGNVSYSPSWLIPLPISAPTFHQTIDKTQVISMRFEAGNAEVTGDGQ